MRGRWTHWILSVTISLVATVLAANQIDWARLGAALTQVKWLWLVVALAFLALSMGAKVIRWRILLADDKRFGMAVLTRALLLGYLLNTILPGRVGELARAGLVARHSGAEFGLAVSSIVMEKILDILTLLVLGAVLSLTVPLPEWLARACQISGMVALTSCVLVALATGGRYRLNTIIERVASGRPHWAARSLCQVWKHGVSPFLEGVSWFRKPRAVVGVVSWSGITWLTGAAVNFSLLNAFSISPAVPAAVVTLVATNLGMAVPSAPGYTGVFHYLSMVALQAFSVDREVALGYAVVAHLLIFGSFVLAGIAAAWRELVSTAKPSSPSWASPRSPKLLVPSRPQQK